MTPYQTLPVQPERGGTRGEGFLTNLPVVQGQKLPVPSRRVLPIVFLPGIMGTNLRMSPDVQVALDRKNNVAWRPDDFGITTICKAWEAGHFDAATRQMMLNHEKTEVDSYNGGRSPTGSDGESSAQRHANAHASKVQFEPSWDSPLLADDPPTKPHGKTKQQKACERGWSEVFFGSYGSLLQSCERLLNSAFAEGRLDERWMFVVGVDPQRWQGEVPSDIAVPKLAPITTGELRKALTDCWFPVHAMGYNWLKSNRASGEYVAGRIRALIAQYRQNGYRCEKVILVTHSMGGLVARAAIHPAMGHAADEVLGIVHGVMPAIGAAAGYARMRSGFEGGPASSIPGNLGSEVTAVLCNSPGGLQLLPSRAYGNGWLRIAHRNQVLRTLPKAGDPYEEIYKNRTAWYRLINETWLNPAGDLGASLKRTHDFLTEADEFHRAIAETYHPNSYAHYGADPGRPAWHHVTWNVVSQAPLSDVDGLRVVRVNEEGPIFFAPDHLPTPATPRGPVHALSRAAIDPGGEPGDQTVPVHSADDQLRSGRFKAVFRQTGYEHQSSYSADSAVHSTLYCLVRIIQQMTW